MPHQIQARHGGDPQRALTTLRDEIDRIDDALLALMEQRVAKAGAVAALKSKAAAAPLPIRPDRERDVLDRLAAAARAMPADAIHAIWRELMALNLQRQQRMELVIHAGAQPIRVASDARQRFGCAAPILVAASAEDALDLARRRHAVAVIELSPLSRWWVALVEDPSLTIFEGLGEDPARPTALAVGQVDGQSLAPGLRYDVLSEATVRRRTAAGETIRPLAVCGHLRLCACEAPQPGLAHAPLAEARL